ncbi:hypothetical protein NN561_007660 [Cricetulus griseus]
MHIVLELLLLVGIIIYSYLESLVKFFIPRRRKSVAGQIALITGAGHGIGRLTAYEFAKRKSRLVLWDINKVKKEVGDVEIVVNNAGAIYPADLLSTKDEEITKTFEVNILGHFWVSESETLLAVTFLWKTKINPVFPINIVYHIPCYKKEIRVCSLCPVAVDQERTQLALDNSSKFAAVGFHRALTAELETLGKTGIKTSCLCPVFVNTGFTKNPSTRFHDVGLGRCQFPRPEGEVLVAALEAVDHHGRGGPQDHSEQVPAAVVTEPPSLKRGSRV